MQILIIRNQEIRNNSRFGLLKVNGNHFGFTLENNLKLISPGKYTGKIYTSPKSGKEVILLENVPGRTFIEIHIANYSSELEGCIAPGSWTEGDMICNSTDVFKRLINLAKLADKIEIEVI